MDKPGRKDQGAGAEAPGRAAGQAAASTAGRRGAGPPRPAPSRLERGAAAEQSALALLERHGLRLVQRNYRVARGPSARAGEIDLILRDRDGTIVFCEVRARADARHGGAAASITAAKRRRIVFAAQCWLARLPAPPPCRFDVVAIDGADVEWLPGAFEA